MTLPDLIARVENGEGADRGLERDVMEALVSDGTIAFRVAGQNFRVTTSLDHLMALLPEQWGCRLSRYPELTQKHHAVLWTDENAEPGDGWFKGVHNTSFPRALLAAILRAKEAGNA
jgi:hypothetical protein